MATWDLVLAGEVDDYLYIHAQRRVLSRNSLLKCPESFSRKRPPSRTSFQSSKVPQLGAKLILLLCFAVLSLAQSEEAAVVDEIPLTCGSGMRSHGAVVRCTVYLGSNPEL